MQQTSLQQVRPSTRSTPLERQSFQSHASGPQCSQLPRQWRARSRLQSRTGLASGLLTRCPFQKDSIPWILRTPQSRSTAELRERAQKTSPLCHPRKSLHITAARRGDLGRQSSLKGPQNIRAGYAESNPAHLHTSDVPSLKPDVSETEQIVVSVLESFHETTEPDFFKEYRDPPYTKLVDPFSDNESDDRDGDDRANEAPSPAESSGRFGKILKQLSDVKRRNVVALMLFTGAECQVAATMAAAAEVQPKTAPSDVSLFRAFGISAPDIYYPKFFEGYWEVDSVLVDVDIPGGIEQLSLPRLASIRDKLDKHEKWEVRYINHKGNIIADRVYNTLSLMKGGVMQLRGIWNPDEANRMRLEVTVDSAGRKTDHGFGVETLITRRSFDSPAPGIFDSSEFSRETTDNTRIYQGPPHVDAKQISSRYKWDPTQEFPDEMKVIQKIATFDLPGEQDSLGKDVENLFRVLSSTTRPSVIKKYVSRMTRKSASAAS